MLIRADRMVLACAAAIVWPSICAHGQIEPQRVYYGASRPIPVTITVPGYQGPKPEGPAEAPADMDAAPPDEPIAPEPAEPDVASQPAVRIDLIRPTGEIVAQAAAKTGQADLAALFPALWTRRAAEAELLYAQLVVGEDRVGPALVLQPLLTPVYPAGATSDGDGRIRPRASIDRAGRPRFLQPEEAEVVYSGLRAWTDRHVLLETSAGTIELILRPDAAPNTVWHFINLVEGGLYTDVPFHRIVPDNAGHPFVIQTGDPSGTGAGGAGFYVDLEPSPLPHGYGVVSMARAADPNTNGSQFYICLSRAGTRHLDGSYASFAQVVAGADAVAQIAAAPTGNDSRPLGDPPTMRRARTIAAPPRGRGPVPLTGPAGEPSER